MQFDILLEAEVLRDFETVYRKSRSRNWFHPYLTEVFALALKLKSAGILEEMAETGYPLRPADASSQDDHRRDFEGRFQDSQPLGPCSSLRAPGKGRVEPEDVPVEVFCARGWRFAMRTHDRKASKAKDEACQERPDSVLGLKGQTWIFDEAATDGISLLSQSVQKIGWGWLHF